MRRIVSGGIAPSAARDMTRGRGDQSTAATSADHGPSVDQKK